MSSKRRLYTTSRFRWHGLGMNAPTKIEAAPNSDCPAMLAHVERWRAQCIDGFAQLEVVIEDLLRELRAASKKGSMIRTGEQVGAAFKQLRELTAANGRFTSKGAKVAATLTQLATWFEWRAHLTHGVLSLWRGANGQWLLSFAHRPSGTESGPVRIFALPWTDAIQLKKELFEQVEILRGNARSLCNSVQKP